MKSCIFQKQEPVDIPQVETRTLKDVLELPCGFEIYGLLTRWNPLNLRTALAASRQRAKKVLIVGLGPAGFTLAHHLMNDGHTVVGVDGLKIEPLPADISGVDAARTPRALSAIRDDVAISTKVSDDRVMAGFGGVAEYGITVRWDKNFLKDCPPAARTPRRVHYVRRRALRRHAHRGQTPLRSGFDHVALCARRGPAHRHLDEKRPRARRAHRPPIS